MRLWFRLSLVRFLNLLIAITTLNALAMLLQSDTTVSTTGRLTTGGFLVRVNSLTRHMGECVSMGLARMSLTGTSLAPVAGLTKKSCRIQADIPLESRHITAVTRRAISRRMKVLWHAKVWLNSQPTQREPSLGYLGPRSPFEHHQTLVLREGCLKSCISSRHIMILNPSSPWQTELKSATLSGSSSFIFDFSYCKSTYTYMLLPPCPVTPP